MAMSSTFDKVKQNKVGPNCICGIATSYVLDVSGFETLCGRGFPHPSRPALGPPRLLYNGYWVFFAGLKRLIYDTV
jgi:hypothetical protein